MNPFQRSVFELFEHADCDSVSWPIQPVPGVCYAEHKLSFLDILLLATGNLPYIQPPQRPHHVLRVFASTTVANLIKELPQFVPNTDADVEHIGELNEIWQIWHVPDEKIIPKHMFLVTRAGHSARGQVTGMPEDDAVTCPGMISFTIVDPKWDRVALADLLSYPAAYLMQDGKRYVARSVETAFEPSTGAVSKLTFIGPLSEEEVAKIYKETPASPATEG